MSFFKTTKDIIYVPNTKSKINIIQISDLHYSSLISEKKLSKIIHKINESKPDYIVITGDTIDSTESINNENRIKIILNFLESLASISKTILSLGNHDFYKRKNKNITFNYPKEFWNQVKNIPNLYLLNNEIYKNEEIEFFGYTQPKNYYWAKKKEEINENVILKDLQTKKSFLKKSSVPKIGLIHSPSCITNEKIIKELQNFDLILSGHMHNGCVFPIIDEIWKSNKGFISASKKLFSHNCRGKIIRRTKNKTINIIISGGITIFSKCAPKFLHPFNIIYPHHINQIIITNDEKEITTKTIHKYSK